jgi:uncharacterized protein YjbJ (UPF0337 family)
MNWDQVEGNWKQIQGTMREQWGKLTDDDIEVIAGRRDRLIGKLQERYGIVREEALRLADDWVKSVHASHKEEQRKSFSGGTF